MAEDRVIAPSTIDGTMTVPDTEETINMTNNGYAILSPLPGDPANLSGSGREAVYSEDGDTFSYDISSVYTT